MTAPMRLGRDDESRLSDKDLWEKKVDEGMSEQAATAYVAARKQPQSHGSSRSFELTADVDRNTAMMKPMGVGEKLRAGLGSLVQGATFNWGDELGAPLAAMLTGQQPEQIRERANLEQERFHAQHPVASTGLNMAGSMVLPVGGAAAGGMKGFLAGAGIGAASGGLDAAGSAPDGQREGAGLSGAVIGGGLAAAIPFFGVPLRKASERIAGTGPIQNAAERFASSRAGRGIANAVRRNVPGLTPQQRADELLLKALERSGMTPADAAARVQASAKPLGAIDVGGNEVQKVARAARTAGGGVARDLQPALQARTEGQVSRIGDDLAAKTGLSRPEWEQAMDELLETRSRNARPLYDAAYQFGEVADDEVRRLVQELHEDAPGLVEQMYDAAAQSARIKDRRKLGPMFLTREVVKDGKKVQVKELAPLTVETLDHLKKGLDAVIEKKAGTEQAIPKADAKSLRARLNAILDRLDDVVVDEQGERIYAKARSQFKGDTELKEAFEAGKDFLKLKPSEVRYRLAKMSDGEKVLFRRRALDQLMGRAEDAADNADVTKVVGGSTSKRGRLAELFADPAEYSAFQDLIKQEAEMFRAQQFITGGSNTADKLTELAEMADVDLGDLLSGGKASNILIKGAKQVWDRTGAGYSRAVSDRLAPSLTAGLDGNQQSAVELFERLAREAEEIARKRRIGAKTTRAAAQQGGGSQGGRP